MSSSKNKTKYRFLIDENLPPDLVDLFKGFGQEAIHINHFDVKKPIKDSGILRYLLEYNEVTLVTADDDFVKSYFSRKIPEKLIFVYGLKTKSDILQKFSEGLVTISAELQEFELIEINAEGVKCIQ